MASSDPKYVRLSNRLSFGMQADVDGSGWSISGLDVKEFPATDGAARYVRKMLRDGKLEPASRAEFDEVQEGNKTVAAVSHQESQVQGEAMRAHRALLESRGIGEDPVGDHEDEMESYQERLDEQDDDDDPEEQVARTNPTRATPKAKSGSKKGKGKKAEEPAES
jgi:hypothetical protein